jgi:hypothetical protein
MPPKKKKGKKGKKKSGKGNGELTDEDRLKLKNHEIDSLKDNLALRRDLTRRSKAMLDEVKEKLDDTYQQIDEIESTHKASSAYLTHQYKTMQTEMQVKERQIELECAITQRKLNETQTKLEHEIAEKLRIKREKEEKIEELEQNISQIRIMYDSIITSTFDTFIENLNEKKSTWEDTSIQVQTKNKILLAELGLKIHDI